MEKRDRLRGSLEDYPITPKRDKELHRKIDRILHLLEMTTQAHPHCRCHAEVDCDIHGPRRR